MASGSWAEPISATAAFEGFCLTATLSAAVGNRVSA